MPEQPAMDWVEGVGLACVDRENFKDYVLWRVDLKHWYENLNTCIDLEK